MDRMRDFKEPLDRLKQIWETYEDCIQDKTNRKLKIKNCIELGKSNMFKRVICDVSDILTALSSEYRLQILLVVCILTTYNNELEYILDLSQSNISHHVRKLTQSGILEKEKKGRVKLLTLTKLGKIFEGFLFKFTEKTAFKNRF